MLFFVVALMPLQSCAQKSSRQEYDEVAISAQASMPASMPMNMPMNMPMADDGMKAKLMKSVSSTPWQWAVPKGWQEVAGSGMRLATFNSTDKSNPIECTIVSLSGQGGSFEANVSRWMGQIKVSFSNDNEFQAFLSKQKKIKTDGGLTAEVVDFTSISSDPKLPSMIAAIISLENEKVFIKMSGQSKALEKNREPFEKLCQSLKQK